MHRTSAFVIEHLHQKIRRKAMALLDTAPKEIQEDSALGSEWLKKQMHITEADLDLIYAEDHEEKP